MTRNVDPKITQEAELWFARRRDPGLCEAQPAAFERWRSQDLRHAAEYARVERLWERLAILQHSQRLREITVPRSGRIHALQSSRRLLLAAGLATVAVAGALWLGQRHHAQIFTTALEAQRTETLADGTTLRLNINSALAVRMTGDSREVILKHGEAAFDVAKDVTRPFVVAVGDSTVTAFGTHFQVRREGGRVAVALIEGRVRVARPARQESEWLEPGQQALFAENASGIVRRNVDLPTLTSWMSGRLEFRGTPMAQAIDEANRYSQRKLRLGDAKLGGIAVSGTFRTGDIGSIAAAFEAAFPVRAENGKSHIVLWPTEEK